LLAAGVGGKPPRDAAELPVDDQVFALSVDSVIPYLVTKGVIDEAALADDSFVIDAVPRRNHNLRVTTSNGSGYFIKQADELSVISRQSVAVEGLFYSDVKLIRPSVAAMLPEFVLYDPAICVLVIRLLSDHQTLRHHCSAIGGLNFPTHFWHGLGGSIAAVHQARTGDPSLVKSVMHTFYPHPNALAAISPAGLKVLEVVQTSGIRNGLARVADLWDPTTFTHGDIRADNIMVASASGQDGIRLIDWELCGRADPMWDIAGCFESGITMSLGRYAKDELYLPVVQTTARGAWGGYHLFREVDEFSSSAYVTKAAIFTAARLVLSALELSELTGDLSNPAVCCLQIAENIFADPQRAAADLFALVS